MRKPIPSDKTRDVLDFATKRPRDRLESITNGLQVTSPLCFCHAGSLNPALQVLQYGQSEYVRQFGMYVNTTGPLRVAARVLRPPMLRYGPGSKQPTIVSSFLPMPNSS
jgi:eukaryotic translation initiation factor 2C